MTITNPNFSSLPERKYEGPARLLHEALPVEKLHETAGRLGKISLIEELHMQYGVRGHGWEVNSTRYEETYKLNADGEMKKMDVVDVVVTPDGDQYAVSREKLQFGMPYMPLGEE